MKTVFWSLILAAGLLCAASVEAQKKGGQGQPKVYRWVDENGEVHFSETVPPDIQNEKNKVQKQAGAGWNKDNSLAPLPPPKPKLPGKDELPRDSSGLQRPKPRYTPAQLRAQQDALLLLRYDSDREILDAMQVEIKQLDYDRRVLTTSKSSLEEAYRGNIREAAERQRGGIKVEAGLVQKITDLKQRLVSNQTSIDDLKNREQEIRKTFEAELDRYQMLVAAQAKAKN